MTQELPTKIGTRIHPHCDPPDSVVELTEEGWLNLHNDYLYHFPEFSIGDFTVISTPGEET